MNPNSAPDFSTGSAPAHHTFMTSLTPNQVTVGAPDVAVTIKGTNFTSSSSACWNCNFLQFQFLPTFYVSPQQLNVTVPANLMANSGQLPISVFDGNSNLFSNNSLSLVVTPVSAPGSSTKVNVVNLAGLAMAWDPVSSLLYVGTAEYDAAQPNSIVAIDGNTGSIVKSLEVGSNPDLVEVSAGGQYVYTAYAGATSMTQVPLPGLNAPLTWTLTNSLNSNVYWAGDLKTAPQSAHTTALTLLDLESEPDEIGGVVVYDDNVERQNHVPGFGPGGSLNIYDIVAWASTDQILTASCFSGCLSNTPLGLLYEIQVNNSGAALIATGTAPFNQGEIHSDFGTGFIYSDDGKVADPKTQAIVGSYNASGLVVPDSSLNKVFILGQTSAQANTNNFTIASFDEKAFTFISSIEVQNIIGDPTELVRYGDTGLAFLTSNGGSGSPGLLYLIQDATFVAKSQAMAVPALRVATSEKIVDFRWKRHSKVDFIRKLAERTRAQSTSSQ
ncbi:MAG: IPT/TIG domain-containing protein [Acidobacteria bacterium]|nr:IPT/TIG domain-containing protein [Acidobacteriota bacterium]